MKVLILVFIFSLTANFSFGQSKETLKSLRAEQADDMNQGIILIPLLSPKEGLVLSKLIENFNIQDYNKEISTTFYRFFNHKKILFYDSDNIELLKDKKDISPYLFDEKMKPHTGKIVKEEVFVVSFIVDGYLKESQYEIQKYKKEEWKLISKEKIIQPEEKSAYQKELDRFKPESFQQGVLLKRLLGKEKKLGKNKRMIINFETYFPCHISLQKDEVFKRLVDEMNQVL